MAMEAHTSHVPGRSAQVFEHSITWEDDIWQFDPHDVVEVHAPARAKFNQLLDSCSWHAAKKHLDVEIAIWRHPKDVL